LPRIMNVAPINNSRIRPVTVINVVPKPDSPQDKSFTVMSTDNKTGWICIHSSFMSDKEWCMHAYEVLGHTLL
jgi:hypothetical protein